MADAIRINQLTYDNVQSVQIVVTSDTGTVTRCLLTLGEWSRVLAKPGTDVEATIEESRAE